MKKLSLTILVVTLLAAILVTPTMAIDYAIDTIAYPPVVSGSTVMVKLDNGVEIDPVIPAAKAATTKAPTTEAAVSTTAASEAPSVTSADNNIGETDTTNTSSGTSSQATTTEVGDSTIPTETGSFTETTLPLDDGIADTIYHNGQSVAQGQAISANIKEGLVIRITTPFSEFLGLSVNGNALVRDVDYKAEEGSTILTIYADTLAKIGEGTHTFTASFAGGKEFSVLVNLTSSEVAIGDSGSAGASDGNKTNPKTGDGIFTSLLMFLAVALAGTGIVVTLKLGKKQSN